MIDLARYEGVQAVMVVVCVFLQASSYAAGPTVRTNIRDSAAIRMSALT